MNKSNKTVVHNSVSHPLGEKCEFCEKVRKETIAQEKELRESVWANDLWAIVQKIHTEHRAIFPIMTIFIRKWKPRWEKQEQERVVKLIGRNLDRLPHDLLKKVVKALLGKLNKENDLPFP